MDIAKLVEIYGSPMYVYDLSAIHMAYKALRSALPEQSTLFYSLKANPHPSIARELASLGCYFEISSLGELASVMQTEGGSRRCLYTGPGKTEEEITRAMASGVSFFSIESPHDLRKLSRCAGQLRSRVRAILRVNPENRIAGMGLTMSGASSQFGAEVDWIQKSKKLFGRDRWVKICGFHFYMGTNISSIETLLMTFRAGLELARRLTDHLGIDLETIDLGGGFGHPYARSGEPCDFSELKLPLVALLDEIFPSWRSKLPRVSFESGRFLVAKSGTLISRVQDVKISKGRTFVVLDTGINHLGGMAGLRRIPNIGAELVDCHASFDTFTSVKGQAKEADATHQISHDSPLVTRAQHGESHSRDEIDVVGPLCTPLDYLARGVVLPDVRPGSIVAVPNVGAYGLTASLIAFLSREAPAEVIVHENKVLEVSRLEMVRRAVTVE